MANINKNNALLDKLIEVMKVKNDAALCRKLEVLPPVLSKIRNGKLPVGPSMIIRIHEVTEMPVKDIKALIA